MVLDTLSNQFPQDKEKECFHLLYEETVQFVVYLCLQNDVMKGHV